MKLELFFAENPIFSIQDLKGFFKVSKLTSTISNLLQYHQKKGHIYLIRKGIYAVLPKGINKNSLMIDPYLLASKLKKDSVLAYQTALALHGKIYTIIHHFYYLTSSRPKKNFEYQGNVYQAVSIPSRLKKSNTEVQKINRMGLDVYLTSLERTFVDILDRPYLCISWEEICRSIESIEFLDIEAVLKYTKLLRNQTTASIVGFFLELYQEKWMISLKYLDQLKKISSNKPFYLDRSLKGKQKFIASWNIIVPQIFLIKKWEEPNEDI